MKTIYLHIGNFKTGTSAIQKFCSDNRRKLLEFGYDYIKSARPRNNNTNHGKIPLSLSMKHGGNIPFWYKETDNFECISKTVIEEIENSHCSKIIISSEEFYRLAGYEPAVVQSAAAEMRDLFCDYTVKVIMYVREPLSMSKSWYNQVNKPNVPTRRFTDFFYYMNNSLLLPQRNAKFWRECFGPDCLVLEPYGLTGELHIKRFFELLGADTKVAMQAPDTLVNRRRNNTTLESDRINRVMLIENIGEREKYLNGLVLSSPEKTKMLQTKVDSINQEFSNFCQAEGLSFPNTNFTLEDLVAYEGKINSENYLSSNILRRKLGQLRYSSFAHLVKRFL